LCFFGYNDVRVHEDRLRRIGAAAQSKAMFEGMKQICWEIKLAELTIPQSFVYILVVLDIPES